MKITKEFLINQNNLHNNIQYNLQMNYQKKIIQIFLDLIKMHKYFINKEK